MTEDSFEKARMAFFGKVAPSSNQNAQAAGAMAAHSEPAREPDAQMTQAVASS